MNVDELEELEGRIREFKTAQRDAARYQRILDELVEISEGSSELNAITFMLDPPRIHCQVKGRNMVEVCSMNDEDHSAFVDEFIEWAKTVILGRITAAKSVMEEV